MEYVPEPALQRRRHPGLGVLLRGGAASVFRPPSTGGVCSLSLGMVRSGGSCGCRWRAAGSRAVARSWAKSAVVTPLDSPGLRALMQSVGPAVGCGHELLIGCRAI